MKVRLGFWRPEPGESDEAFAERVFTEMTAAIARLKGGGESADPEVTPEDAVESGGAA